MRHSSLYWTLDPRLQLPRPRCLPGPARLPRADLRGRTLHHGGGGLLVAVAANPPPSPRRPRGPRGQISLSLMEIQLFTCSHFHHCLCLASPCPCPGWRAWCRSWSCACCTPGWRGRSWRTRRCWPAAARCSAGSPWPGCLQRGDGGQHYLHHVTRS